MTKMSGEDVRQRPYSYSNPGYIVHHVHNSMLLEENGVQCPVTGEIIPHLLSMVEIILGYFHDPEHLRGMHGQWYFFCGQVVRQEFLGLLEDRMLTEDLIPMYWCGELLFLQGSTLQPKHNILDLADDLQLCSSCNKVPHLKTYQENSTSTIHRYFHL